MLMASVGAAVTTAPIAAGATKSAIAHVPSRVVSNATFVTTNLSYAALPKLVDVESPTSLTLAPGHHLLSTIGLSNASGNRRSTQRGGRCWFSLGTHRYIALPVGREACGRHGSIVAL